MKSSEFIRPLKEDASAGASSSGAVASVSTALGGSTKSLIKRQRSYTNQRTSGGTVKAKK
jgi:hypothetical protein